MSQKIFSGVPGRPLGVVDRLRVWWWQDRPRTLALWRWWFWHWVLYWTPRQYRSRRAVQKLAEALTSGSYMTPVANAGTLTSQRLEIEDLSATMEVVTFDARDLRRQS